ncbi:hypothetical protein KCP69_18745 [Salmonella enterica subsp. enterica]|nr:hypothetical protein KCP69_18745 [Salmonella enterica subsp. enterica]
MSAVSIAAISGTFWSIRSPRRHQARALFIGWNWPHFGNAWPATTTGSLLLHRRRLLPTSVTGRRVSGPGSSRYLQRLPLINDLSSSFALSSH